MMNFIYNLDTLSLICLVVSFVYGFKYGVKNLIVGLVCLVSRQKLLQSETGKYLDILFLASLIYFSLVFFKQNCQGLECLNYYSENIYEDGTKLSFNLEENILNGITGES